MNGSTAGATGTADIVALSVHGPAGRARPASCRPRASAADVAVEYARQSGLGVSPALFSRLGRPLPPDVTLADAGVASGAVLVAVDASPRRRRPSAAAYRRRRRSRRPRDPAPLSVLWFCTAAAAALLAGWFAAHQDDVRPPHGDDRAADRRGGARRACRSAGSPPTGCSPPRPSPVPRRSRSPGTPSPPSCRRSSASPGSRPRLRPPSDAPSTSTPRRRCGSGWSSVRRSSWSPAAPPSSTCARRWSGRCCSWSRCSPPGSCRCSRSTCPTSS